MLQGIRDNLQGWVLRIIIGAIAVGFVFFGVDFMGARGDKPAVEVNGEPITERALQAAMRQERQRILAQFDGSMDPAKLDDAALFEPVRDRLITERLMDQAAETMSLDPSLSLVDRMIVRDPSFAGEDGRFSMERFEAVLAQSGFSPRYYRQALRERIQQRHLFSGFELGALVTDANLAHLITLLRESRDIRYLVVPPSSVADRVVVTDAAVQAYFNAHAERFQTPPAVDVSYLELTMSALYPEIPEPAIRARYEEEQAAYEGRTERQAAHILLERNPENPAAARERAAELKQQLADGGDFAELAREHSADPGSASSGGALGYSDGTVFPETFEAALADLEVGEVSDPVETESGIHLIKLLDVREAAPPTYAEARDRIERALQRQEAEGLFVTRAEQLADLTFTSPDLATASTELGLSVQEAKSVTRQTDDAVLSHPQVRAALFSEGLRSGEQNSEVIELSPEHVVVLHVDAYYPPRAQSLDEVRETVEAEVRAEQEQKALAEEAGALKQALVDGASIEALALDKGYEWRVGLRANRFASTLPPAVLDAAFAAPAPPEGRRVLTQASLPSDEGLAVVEVSGVRPGNPAAMSEPEKASMRRFFRRRDGLLAASAFQHHLRQRAEIDLHEAP